MKHKNRKDERSKLNMFKYPFEILPEKRIRVIISADAKNEADDQYAITYGLLSPSLDVVGIAAAHFSAVNPRDSVEQSYQEILLILEKMGLSGKIPVLMGAQRGLADENTPHESEAARFIIEQAHSEGNPLYVVCTGAITDLASAYLMDPTIGKKIKTAIWLGGNAYPKGGSEFNLMNDIAAANVIMSSNIKLWQIPINASVCMRVGIAELIRRVSPCGEIGKYLVDQLVELSRKQEGPCEHWIMWDIAAIALLLDPHRMQYHFENAPIIDKNMYYIPTDREHIIRVYDRVEPRFAFEDMFSKLELCFGR